MHDFIQIALRTIILPIQIHLVASNLTIELGGGSEVKYNDTANDKLYQLNLPMKPAGKVRSVLTLPSTLIRRFFKIFLASS